jgi:NAD(P)-dependent dehydrogenase (short-subunit alcohol dehydrogenase family)
MPGQVLIVGATGSVGSELVALLDRSSGKKVRAATREPAAARRGSDSAAEFVQFDRERPQTVAPALDDVDRLFLIARPGDEHPDRFACPSHRRDQAARRHVIVLIAVFCRHPLRGFTRFGLEVSTGSRTHPWLIPASLTGFTAADRPLRYPWEYVIKCGTASDKEQQ